MNKIFILSLLLSLSSCWKKSKTTIESSYSNGSNKIVHYYPDETDKTYFERKFYHENGQLGSQGYFKNWEMTGVWKWWYDNGNLQAYSVYKNGYSKDSTYCYSVSGRIARKLYQIDSVKNIWVSTDYFESGQKKIETYLIGKPKVVDSVFTQWNEKGQLILQGEMDSTKKVGIWKVLNENDSLIDLEMDGSETITFEE